MKLLGRHPVATAAAPMAAAGLAAWLAVAFATPAAVAGALTLAGAIVAFARPPLGLALIAGLALTAPYFVVPIRLGSQPPVIDVVLLATLAGTARALWRGQARGAPSLVWAGDRHGGGRLPRLQRGRVAGPRGHRGLAIWDQAGVGGVPAAGGLGVGAAGDAGAVRAAARDDGAGVAGGCGDRVAGHRRRGERVSGGTEFWRLSGGIGSAISAGWDHAAGDRAAGRSQRAGRDAGGRLAVRPRVDLSRAACPTAGVAGDRLDRDCAGHFPLTGRLAGRRSWCCGLAGLDASAPGADRDAHCAGPRTCSAAGFRAPAKRPAGPRHRGRSAR